MASEQQYEEFMRSLGGGGPAQPPAAAPGFEEDRGRSREREPPASASGTRWADPTQKIFLPNIPSFLAATIPYPEMEALLIRIRLEEIAFKIANNQYDLDLGRRSPSPTPVYDAQGRRLNTRDQRAKDKLNLERQRLINRAKEIHPNFKPPMDHKPVSQKKFRKIYIPVKEYPDYNFFGLIVGPRGSTQKQMERETGCKIAIRGKGSVKPGKGETQRQEDEDDELHVLVTGDSEEMLNAAEDMVRRLLVPVDDSMNEHKKNQLRKLAEWNGTLRDNMPGAGLNRSWQPPDVFCKFCGEVSHPSSDCPLKNKPANLDSHYESFMAMIGEGSGSGASAATEKSYEELMASISAATTAPQPPAYQQQQQPPMPPPQQPAYPGYPPQMPGAPWQQQQQQQQYYGGYQGY